MIFFPSSVDLSLSLLRNLIGQHAEVLRGFFFFTFLLRWIFTDISYRQSNPA